MAPAKVTAAQLAEAAEQERKRREDAAEKAKKAARKENHRMVVKRGQVAKDNRAAFVAPAQRVAAE